MSEEFPFGIMCGIILGILYSALIWTDHVYDYNIDTARAACAQYGGIRRIEANIFKGVDFNTVTTCKDGTKVRRSNKP